MKYYSGDGVGCTTTQHVGFRRQKQIHLSTIWQEGLIGNYSGGEVDEQLLSTRGLCAKKNTCQHEGFMRKSLPCAAIVTVLIREIDIAILKATARVIV
jgi:hypothetical protein